MPTRVCLCVRVPAQPQVRIKEYRAVADQIVFSFEYRESVPTGYGFTAYSRHTAYRL